MRQNHRIFDRLVSVEEYMEFEKTSPVRHEYVAGEVFAMTGATTRHNLITLNTVAALRGPAKRRGCRVFAEAVMLRVGDRVYYPDVIIACGSAAQVDLVIKSPSVIVEVSSPATRATDRREKLEVYRSIPSLQQYLIVAQRFRHVLTYTRADSGEWERSEVGGSGDVPVVPLDITLSLDALYDDVPLPPLAVGDGDPEEWELVEGG
jgi:Uma2 family endonuclease